MYIIAIAWIYVTLLMAATESSFVGGVLTFLLYGLGPLALFVWVLAVAGAQSPCANRPISQTVITPSPISSTCCAVARSSVRLCRPGIRSATAT